MVVQMCNRVVVDAGEVKESMYDEIIAHNGILVTLAAVVTE